MKSRGYVVFKNAASAAVILVLALGIFAVWHTVLGANSSSITSKVIVPNSAPTVSSVTLNANASLTLTPNVTTTFNIAYIVQDANGCADIRNITSTAFRFGVKSTCEVEDPITSSTNCYTQVSHTTSTCISSFQLNGTDTVDIYYFANATDASSSFTTDSWEAYVVAKDFSGATSTTATATSSSDILNTLTAIVVTTTTINYGSISANANSGSTNQNATTTNAGNSSTTLQLYTTATLVNGGNSIATSNQVYATSSFSYGSGSTSTAITGSAVTLPDYFVTAPTSTATSGYAKATFWGLAVPNGTASGSYSGTDIFQSLFKP